tara:strand:+ start:1957 stop:2499 length:543 start_codon:yes stop_codon:yes gene_type:complete
VKKSTLRKKVIKKRLKLNNKDFKINPNVIINLIKKNTNKKKVGLYYPFNGEVSTLNLIDRMIQKKFEVSLPIVKKKFQLSFYKWRPQDPLKVNKFGIPEPLPLKKTTPSILIIPLVAFDKNLNRLGYGGGFYDRLIQKIEKKMNCLKIGLALSCQKIDKVPIGKFDKKMNFVVTEKKIYK